MAAACPRSEPEKLEIDSVPGPWFALQIAARMEMRAASALQAKGFEPFLPKYKVKRIWSDRVKTLELPLFPGYVFCRLNEGGSGLVVATSGVLRIVSFGGKPCPVNEQDMLAIQKISCSNADVTPCPFENIGHKVRILEGPLAGVVGIIIRNKKQRLIVSIEMLMRSVAIDVDVEKVSLIAA